MPETVAKRAGSVSTRQPSPEFRAELRRILKQRFPWLGTNRAIDYKDELQRLVDLYAAMKPPDPRTVGVLVDGVGCFNCRRCGRPYSSAAQFRKHLRTQHGVRISLQDIRWVADNT